MSFKKTMLVLALAVLLPAQSTFAASLIFSEYVEGSSFNKAVEIYNTTASPVDLSACRLELYSNGSGTVSQFMNLAGTLAPGDVFVAAHASANPAILAVADVMNSSVINFNGDDALVLQCGGAVEDSIGQVGFDPGTEWGVGSQSTADNTIRRLPSVCVGDTDPSNVYDPTIEWTGFAVDTFDGLGVHTAACAAGPTLIVNDVLQAEGQTGTSIFTFTVSLTQPAGTGGVTFDIATADNTALAGSDYVSNALVGQSIAAGQSSYSFDVTVNGDTTVEPNETFFVNVTNITGASPGDTQGLGTIENDDFTLVPIHTIQGSGNASPLAGTTVSARGIVTGTKFGSSGGFYIQAAEADADADPNTSEGIFVFTGSTLPAGAVIGNDVTVTGTVAEFIPGADPFSPPLTELTSATVFVHSSGNPLPAAVTLTAADTNPAGPIEQLEKFEGMRVHVPSLTAVSPTAGFISEANATATSTGVFYGVITGIPRPFREPGIAAPQPPPNPPCCIPQFDNNPERLRVDSDGQYSATPLDVTAGATVTNLVGPLDFGFRTYTILPDAATPPVVTGNVTFTAVPVPNADEFTIAGQNLQRFYDDVNDSGGDVVLTPAAYDNRLNKASLLIRDVLRSPDILGVSEAENITVLQDLAAKVNADTVTGGGADPMYTAHLVEGNDQGLIDVGFLVKTTRVTVNAVTQVGATATYINPNNGQPEIIFDRPPLVLEATVVQPGLAITVIANHLRSLSDIDDAVDGNRVRTKRRAGAEWLANYIQGRQVAAPDEKIVMVGDFNAFEFNDGYVDVMGTILGTPTPVDQVVLASPDLVNPDFLNGVATLPAVQRYSYSFDGNAQTLDHIVGSDDAALHFSRMSFARAGADFPEVYRNDSGRPERLTDHDGAVVYLTFQPGGTHFEVTVPANVTQGVPFSVTVTARDSMNNVLTTYNGTVHFTSSDGGAVLPADYTFTAGDAGVHTFTDAFTLVTPGPQSITATDTLNSAITGTGNTTVDCPVVTVTATNNGPICEGATLQLDVTDVPGATYAWTGPNGFTSAIRNPVIAGATTAASGTYNVTVSVNSCAYPASTVAAVNAIPALPVITAPGSVVPGATNVSASVADHPGSTYAWTLTGGTIVGGQGTASIQFDAGPAGTVMTLSVVETAAGCSSPAASTRIVVDFLDVPTSHPFHSFVVSIARAGITAGCGGGNFCVNDPTLRSQMAVFLVRGVEGESFVPPPATGIFTDVPPGSFAADWIEAFYNMGGTAGCATNPLRYCPNDAVSRAEMAVFLLWAKHGAGYTPPAAQGIFEDVPVGSFAADWIEQLYQEGITAGCATNPLRFCPNNPTTRGEMAVFLTSTLGLP